MDYEGMVAQGRCSARPADRHRRRAVHGEADRAPRALLRARELRAVHAVPRRHGLDDEDPRAHRGGRGHDGGPRHADRHRRQHDRQDDLRAERLVRGAGRVGHQEVPRRIRGAHHGKRRRTPWPRRSPDG